MFTLKLYYSPTSHQPSQVPAGQSTIENGRVSGGAGTPSLSVHPETETEAPKIIVIASSLTIFILFLLLYVRLTLKLSATKIAPITAPMGIY